MIWIDIYKEVFFKNSKKFKDLLSQNLQIKLRFKFIFLDTNSLCLRKHFELFFKHLFFLFQSLNDLTFSILYELDLHIFSQNALNLNLNFTFYQLDLSFGRKVPFCKNWPNLKVKWITNVLVFKILHLLVQIWNYCLHDRRHMNTFWLLGLCHKSLFEARRGVWRWNVFFVLFLVPAQMRAWIRGSYFGRSQVFNPLTLIFKSSI